MLERRFRAKFEALRWAPGLVVSRVLHVFLFCWFSLAFAGLSVLTDAGALLLWQCQSRRCNPGITEILIGLIFRDLTNSASFTLSHRRPWRRWKALRSQWQCRWRRFRQSAAATAA